LKNILVLGATGTIGQNALEVISHYPSDFRLCGASAHSDLDGLLAIGKKFKTDNLCLSGSSPGSPQIRFSGIHGLQMIIEESRADIVINGISGSAGLLPSFWTLGTSKRLALANKETIVMAGDLFLAEAKKKSTEILPVDSEHSAVFQLINGTDKKTVSKIILTASGGRFYDYSKENMKKITWEEAIIHPNWKMGHKITVDSSTLANKGLEVIEACYLFDIGAENVEVVIHPQSLVHSLIRTFDGSLYAQISRPDMKIPILNALSWPDRMNCEYADLDLTKVTMDFFSPDTEKFPMLKLAFECARQKGYYPAVYNAANEIAVEAFSRKNLSFTQIAEVTANVLEKDWGSSPSSLEEVLATDEKARTLAREAVNKTGGK
jgi:1-deoxy-D-xylulose-5-phosphate reductoisomerase